MAMLPCHPPCLLLTLLTGRPECTTTTTTSFMLSSSATSSMILIGTARIKKDIERSKEEHEHWMSKEQKKLQKMADKAKQKQLIKDWKEWWHNKKAWSSCQAQNAEMGGQKSMGRRWEETGDGRRQETGGDRRREETGDGRRQETGGDRRREETGDGRRQERMREWGHAK
ncbi:hypothetical protein BD769DRAFT_1387661 [Suillus cothurnatus]|nr:hypothetical protein BD769DRAFT_1387661 [Suillus cothurnatus]